jgi:hypothetical protein
VLCLFSLHSRLPQSPRALPSALRHGSAGVSAASLSPVPQQLSTRRAAAAGSVPTLRPVLQWSGDEGMASGSTAATLSASQVQVASAVHINRPGGDESRWPPSDPASCDGYFGNGFVNSVDMVPEGLGARFMCVFNPVQRTHVCDAGGCPL